MEQLVATRTELLVRRERLALAAQGRNLLKSKRDQLMEEFRRVSGVVLGGAERVASAAVTARRARATAEAHLGPEAVASAALPAGREIPLRVRRINVMGVRLADIDYGAVGRPPGGRGTPPDGTHPLIDDAAAAFEAEVDGLLDLASHELRLRRLADEIGKATRRINALEFVVIPQVEAEIRHIRVVLEERERQEHFRLKRIKTRRGPRLSAGEAS